MKRFRTPDKEQVAKNIQGIFEACPDSIELKLENFPKYVKRALMLPLHCDLSDEQVLYVTDSIQDYYRS